MYLITRAVSDTCYNVNILLNIRNYKEIVSFCVWHWTFPQFSHTPPNLSYPHKNVYTVHTRYLWNWIIVMWKMYVCKQKLFIVREKLFYNILVVKLTVVVVITYIYVNVSVISVISTRALDSVLNVFIHITVVLQY